MNKPLPPGLVPNLAGKRDVFLQEAERTLREAVPKAGDVVLLVHPAGADHTHVLLHVRNARALGQLTMQLMDELAKSEEVEGRTEQADRIRTAMATIQGRSVR